MLASTIVRRFEGARCEPDPTGLKIEVPVDGTLYRAHAAMSPFGRIAVELPRTDGFDLALAWTD